LKPTAGHGCLRKSIVAFILPDVIAVSIPVGNDFWVVAWMEEMEQATIYAS